VIAEAAVASFTVNVQPRYVQYLEGKKNAMKTPIKLVMAEIGTPKSQE